MIVPRLSLAFGLLAGAAASQLPEYGQQYRQRLGGAIGELTPIVQKFEAESRAQGLTFEQGVTRLAANADILAQQRGAAVAQAAQRLTRLTAQQDALSAGGPFARMVALLGEQDPNVARGAWQAYEPALPTSWEGAEAALLGLALGMGLFHAGALPFRHRVRPGMATAQA